MMRIDAHQHFWRLAERGGAWPPRELTAIYRDFYPEQLAPHLAQHRIEKTVLVQSMPNEADTLFMLDLADRHQFIGAVVGWVNLKAPNATARIMTMASHPKLRGLRPMLQDLDDDAWIDDPALTPAVEAMLSNGLVLNALVLPRHLRSLLAFARRYPELPIVIDHVAKPAMDGELPAQWLNDMDRLAAEPQVDCKLSGMVTEAGPDWTVDRLPPYARHVLETFGPSRVMWGSDWPVLELAASYGAWVQASESLLDRLAPAQREAIFGLNAKRFYRIP